MLSEQHFHKVSDMEEMKNYAEMEFINPIVIDIFSHFADNSVMAGVVSENGTLRMRFKVSPDIVPPTSSEQILSLMFALFESNPDTPMGKCYMENQTAILRETIYRLGQVMDGFRDVRMTINVTDPETGSNKRTQFALTKTSHTNRS